MMVCFLAPAGCFVFMGTLGFCFCGYDLLTGLVRTPKVTRRPPRTFSFGMRSSKRIAGFDRGGFGLAATAGLLGALGWSVMRRSFARVVPQAGKRAGRPANRAGGSFSGRGQVAWTATGCGCQSGFPAELKNLRIFFGREIGRGAVASFCGRCCRRMRPVASF